MSPTLAVVGAGAAGAATAYALRDAPVDVTVFEKSGGVCGRATTRRANDCTYEYAANYLTDDDDRVTEIVTEELSTDGLVDVTEPIWTFDERGETSGGDDVDTHRWSYESGLAELAKRLFAATDAAVHQHTRVDTLEREDSVWRVVDADGDDRGAFDAVVLTPPAPQTADLLGQAAWEHTDCRDLRKSIAQVPFRTVISVVLHYDFELDVPYYALVNEDEGHDIGWVAREECKPGHVPDGQSLLLTQMAPDWSAEYYHEPAPSIVDAAAEKTADLLGNERLIDPNWTDHQHWRYALPNGGPAVGTLDEATDHDLFFAGDWVAGDARLHAAVRSGLETGEAVADHL
jgi:predicted NAD/FAD-dependent oxidoreductase